MKSVGQSPEKALETVTLAQGRHGCEMWFVSPVLVLTSQNPMSGILCLFIYLFILILCLIPGKEITLLMQTLNTLSTPEEKLAALCKKYAELVSAHFFVPGSGAGGGHCSSERGSCLRRQKTAVDFFS